MAMCRISIALVALLVSAMLLDCAYGMNVAIGRVNGRPGKRNVASGRWNLRPGKRSIATGRLSMRPGKRAGVATCDAAELDSIAEEITRLLADVDYLSDQIKQCVPEGEFGF